jgi:hypothetical protein
MELHGNRELTYLYAGGTPFAIHQKQGQTEQLFYLHTDYQGSIRAITNEQGIVIETRDYDAWGRPRNASTLEYTATNPATARNEIQPRCRANPFAWYANLNGYFKTSF